MKKIRLTLVIIFIAILNMTAQDSCMNSENLKKLDASWEESLKGTNVAFFESTLSEDFIWVHTHAGRIDSKKTLLELINRIRNGRPDHWKSRIQKNIEIIISGTTGVVYGFTEIEKYDGSKTTYHFMRTYAEKDGKCYLIANHTMAIPEKEED